MSRQGALSGNTRWRHATGRAAEDLAARYLESRGCEIVARRFRCNGGEIDLIVDDGGTLAFVEVKARRGHRFGTPAEAVTSRKRRRLGRAARAFLRIHRLRRRRCRFDVVAIRLHNGRAETEWMRDAFRP